MGVDFFAKRVYNIGIKSRYFGKRKNDAFGRVLTVFLHIGNDVVVRKTDIIAVFDMDNTTISRQSRDFLQKAQKDKEVIDICEDLPKSYIVTNCDGKTNVYISSVSSQTIYKRSGLKKMIF